jgi:adenylate kinase
MFSLFIRESKEKKIMLKAIVFGAPGAGKGTYATRLQVKLGVDVIAMGDIFREIVKEKSDLAAKVKGYMEKGSLVPDDVVVEVLKSHLAKISGGKGFILDGYPRTLDQAKKLDGITQIDVIMQLNVPDWIIIERLSTRRVCKNCGTIFNVKFLKPKVEGVCDKCGGSLYQRADDNPETIKNRLKVYQEQTAPLIEFYKEKKVPFIELETKTLDQPPEVMVDKLFAELKRLNFA